MKLWRIAVCGSLVTAVVSWTSVVPSRSRWSNRRLTSFHHHHHQATASSSSSSSSVDETSTVNTPPTIGSIVTVDCSLIPQGVWEPLIDGIVLHDDEPPQRLTFVLGKGNYLPGLHETVLGMMKVGDEIDGLSLDAGWGDPNPNLIATLTFRDSGMDKSQIKPGVQLYLVNGLKCTVTDVEEESFTIDANPPLAGASYNASIQLLNVEQGPDVTEYSEEDEPPNKKTTTTKYDVATFALGCFWGVELEYMRIPGVVGTAVGFTQGSVENPSYEQTCAGTTGHTEAVVVTYDPDVVSYEKLVHTAMDRLGENKYLLNQVGNDKGTQYRHGVYYHNPVQKKIAEGVVSSYGEDCVTEVLPATKFWFAEDYHQQYLLKGGQSARKGDESVIRCYG